MKQITLQDFKSLISGMTADEMMHKNFTKKFQCMICGTKLEKKERCCVFYDDDDGMSNIRELLPVRMQTN